MIILAVDARPLTRVDSGIKRYTASILREFVQNSDFKIILYLDQELPGEEIEITNHTQCRIYSGPKILHQILWFVYVQKWLRQDKPDIFWSPRHHLPRRIPQKTKTVVTIHDLIWKSHPQTMKKAGYINELLHMSRSIKQADLIFSPTQHTKTQIVNYWPSAKPKIRTIKHGVDFDVQSSAAPQPNVQKYFLAVGTLEPRKNYPRLIHAFDKWVEGNQQYQLLIVGRKGWKAHKISKALSNCRNSSVIRILSNVNDDELIRYYQNAAVFVQISVAEGFGLPILEAQSYGLPLLLSDIPVFHEFVSDLDAVWVDPYDMQSIKNGFSEGVKKSLSEPQDHLRSWQQTAAEIRQNFEALIASEG